LSLAVEARSLLHDVADHAADWLDGVADRPVRPDVVPAGLQLTRTLAGGPVPVEQVVADLVARRFRA
jgi:hypothetical protein